MRMRNKHSLSILKISYISESNKFKKMSDLEKSYSYHSVIVPANHVVTTECFINEGCATWKPVLLLCLIYI